MTERRTPLRVLDRLDPPDLWTDIRERSPRDVSSPARGRRVVAALVALAVAAAGVVLAIEAFPWGPPKPPAPAVSASAGRIAFAWYDASSYQIYTANPDGTDLQQVTHMPISVSNPTWSPDGTKIAFQGETVGGEGGRLDIYISNADGSGIKQLTQGPDSYQSPSWSPDGTTIAATRWSASGQRGDIVLLSTDGTRETVVTQGAAGDSWGPVWSPDGTRIAFESNRDTDGALNNEIWLVNQNGSDPMDVTSSPAYDRDPTWSPDGTRIAFFTGPQGSPDLEVMNADGSDRHTLVTGVEDGGEPSWSPDGSKLAFIEHDYRLGTGRLEILDLESGQVTQPLDLVGVGGPAWQTIPDTGMEPSPSGAPIGSGWTQLPEPPRQNSATMVWTGTQLLSWGGWRNGAAVDEGYAFSPSTRLWTSMPTAPGGRMGTKAIWTGSEAIFWGGWDDQALHDDGFAFDPAKGMWRAIPPAPIPNEGRAVVVWTGTEMIVWGGGKRGDASNTEGAAYDPSTDTWRRIADAPFGLNAASAVWTGSEMIVFGSLLDAGNHAATSTAVGAAYDPASDSWRALPASNLSPQASAAVWLDDRLIAYDYGWKTEAYLPAIDGWQSLPDLPFSSGECYPDGAVVGGRVFAFGCGEAATLSPSDDLWHRVRGGITEATVTANAGTYKLWRFATLVPAGDILFVQTEGITVERDGTPCYGCAGSPTSFWAYRP